MAKLRILKQKDKRYAFKVFGNEKQKKPALCVFKRFPRPEETFYSGMRKNLTENLTIDVDEFKNNKDKATKKISEQIVQAFLDNLNAGRIDYEEFAKECIERFEDFGDIDSGEKIETVNQFLSLPQEAMLIIARDCYEYARESDEFEMGE